MGDRRSVGWGDMAAFNMANENARTLRKNLTRQEVRMWLRLRALRDIGFHFRRQAPVGRYIVDFLSLKHRLIIEIDGGQHGYDDHAARDAMRDADLAKLGFDVMRFWNTDVDTNIEGVVSAIVARLRRRSS